MTYDTDLVGTGRPWGKVRDLERWQAKIYNSYHGKYVAYNYPNHPHYKRYGGRGYKFLFTSLSHYWEVLQHLPHYEDLINNPDRWDIYCDGDCSPTTIFIDRTNRAHGKISTSRSVVVKAPTGTTQVFPSVTDCAKRMGCSTRTIYSICASEDHLYKRGFLRGFEFYWED